jgi:hypothetical protein
MKLIILYRVFIHSTCHITLFYFQLYIYLYMWKFILKFDSGHASTIFCGASEGPRPWNGIVFVSIIGVQFPFKLLQYVGCLWFFSTLLSYYVIVETLWCISSIYIHSFSTNLKLVHSHVKYMVINQFYNLTRYSFIISFISIFSLKITSNFVMHLMT